MKKIILILIFMLLIASTFSVSGLVSDIIFSDDFNDNEKDFDKWTEIFAEGTWEEVNQQTEFLIYEYYPNWERFEGLESSNIPIILTTSQSVLISADIISDIGSTGFVGLIYMRITDGTNWILAYYHIGSNRLIFFDSNDDSEIVLGTRGHGTWSNYIEIFSNRYKVTMDSYDSGWIYDSIFPSNPLLKVQIYTSCGGTSPPLFMRAGFDNIIVKGSMQENHPPDRPKRPIGPNNGRLGISYTYQSSTTDPENDHIWYMFDWDDGTTSDWDGPHESGSSISKSHIWETEGFYSIKVKAKDSKGYESVWSEPLAINMPRDKTMSSFSIFRFLDCFPFVNLILHILTISYN